MKRFILFNSLNDDIIISEVLSYLEEYNYDKHQYILNRLLEKALDLPIDGDLFKMYLCYLVRQDENLFTIKSEKVGNEIDKNLFIERHRHLQAQKHAALAVVKHVEFGQNFAEIVAADRPALRPAMFKQPRGTVPFVVKAVQVYAGVHAAVRHGHVRQTQPVPVADKDKRVLRDKAPGDEVFFSDGCADIVGQHL